MAVMIFVVTELFENRLCRLVEDHTKTLERVNELWKQKWPVTWDEVWLHFYSLSLLSLLYPLCMHSLPSRHLLFLFQSFLSHPVCSVFTSTKLHTPVNSNRLGKRNMLQFNLVLMVLLASVLLEVVTNHSFLILELSSSLQ